MAEYCEGTYLDSSNGLLTGHLKGVSVLGTQEELHLDAGAKYKTQILSLNDFHHGLTKLSYLLLSLWGKFLCF